MNKKIILSLLIILCLLTSVSFVLAQENGSSDSSIDENVNDVPTTDVPVSAPARSGGSSVAGAPSDNINIDLTVIWNGGSAPDFIEVDILKDGKLVKTVTLSENNDWKATVELPMYDDGGNKITYDVKEATPEGFDVSYSGNQETGFIITNNPAQPVLGASNNPDDSVSDGPSDGPVGPSDGLGDDSQTPEDGDSAQEDSNDTNSSDDPQPVPEDNNSTSDDNNNSEPANKTVKVVKKVVKVHDKDKKPEQKPIPHAGNPIAVLVIVLIGVVFASFRRRRE